MKNNFLIKSIKKNSIYILFLIVIIFLIFIKYNSSEQFTVVQPQCFSRLDNCNLDIVLVIGQSNANGPNVRNNDPNITNSYKTDPTYSDDLDYVINPNIFRVRLVFDNLSQLLVNPQPARICEARESSSSFSTDVSFAREYFARTGRKVLIINASRSSTAILTSHNNSKYIWQKTNLGEKIQLYNPVKNFVNLVKTKICSSSKVVAIIYRGSEEDSYKSPRAHETCGSTGLYDSTYLRTYNSKFSELLNSFKTDIGDSSTKILVSGLMLNDTKKCMTYFSINILKELSRQNGYTFVDTDRVRNNKVKNIKYFQRKLTANGGNTEVGSGVHFDKLSQIELGKRLAYAYFDPNYNVG